MVQTGHSILSLFLCGSIRDQGHCFKEVVRRPSGLTRDAGVVQTYLFNTEAGVRYPKTVAAAKTGAPFGQEILRGIFCNWMVCLGVWQVIESGCTD